MASICRLLLHHKYAAPSTPNLDAITAAINAKLQPICFHIKNDPNYSTYVYDQHFYGILCSPLFEGKSYKEINAMVEQILEPLGLKGCVRLNCQPPSRFHKLRNHIRWRWNVDK
ncbi:uncharacterized protein BBOV_IV007740 [Babesia bovis T2Bo]|uniref:Uncharacterized protein n=1 Tax=Babesia bovis TaxID=5865 RepID=A7ARF9_BABBO|nr:uncharacterized protein BBOV_IV007740 [Babesia bovis T2Bo]EDO07128.1 hypothetical protein BBOV_IV007740 [Babesia bovis T2Bo]BAN65473.1 hypothetical protein [Babesia bovis]|eukprot:XP_001610696.1 hypothetical protein [Babesia bovis T2Bo]